MAKAFTHDGIGIITFKPNLEGQMMKTKELEISVLDHWVDVRGEDGRIITYPREEIFEIEWEDRW